MPDSNMQDNITQMVVQALQELNEEWGKEELREPDKDTRLFGPGGNLDSLALVALILELEERVYEELECDVSLADDRAMSQSVSPFRSVRALSAYLSKLVAEQKA